MVIIIQALIGLISEAHSFAGKECCPLSGYVEICEYEHAPVTKSVPPSNGGYSPVRVSVSPVSHIYLGYD